ncbi:TIGR03088 family PEP-CTERM/XrtA system glycosyltransferase [Caenispirillum bisanense]|uniref:TIGR03088 family PEP-CTERM/XrtA system glycosyltransferase n=1 Tax=Caenispirillum bisanense TaxID=414052 RepID=UPI0031DD86FB
MTVAGTAVTLARPSSQPSGGRVPLVVHVVDSLGVGGMENGLVNIINGTPPGRCRHAVVCLRESGPMAERLRDPAVAVHVLGKKPGKDPAAYGRLWRLMRALRPDVVHTRNLPAADMVVPAWCAGVPVIVHGEHGRDAIEETGANRRYNLLRRLVEPAVDHYIALSREIETWLTDRVGLPEAKISRIINGVDTARFHPPRHGRAPLAGAPEGFAGPDQVVFGTVGRMAGVKDQVTLARAFVSLLDRLPEARARLRLVLVGDGPLREECAAILAAAGASDLAWLPGRRDDVPGLLRGLDVFVLPSRTEGICNTILEAMATGLPVVATRVGGNPELVDDGRTGVLVPRLEPDAMAAAMAAYAADAALRCGHGEAGRARVMAEFALDRMVDRYLTTYERLLAHRAGRRAAA